MASITLESPAPAPATPPPLGAPAAPRLKIAHLYQEPGIQFDEPRAAQLHIYHTIRGLQQAGHAVTLLSLQDRQVLCTADLQVFRSRDRQPQHFGRLGLSGGRGFKLFESAVRRVQSTLRLPYLALFDSYRLYDAACQNLASFDLIYERFNLLSLAGVWASRRLGLPLVLEINADLLEQRRFKGVPERGLRRVMAVWATRAAFRTATKVICISAGLKAHLQSHWGVSESKLTVLPCAADTQAFQPGAGAASVRRRLGLSTEPVIMWVGGFFPWHDLDLLVHSFARVLARHPNARLVLVGDGPTRPSLEQLLKTGSLEHAVILTGTVAHAQVPELLALADVAVVPAAPVQASGGGTGTPLKLFEYMAAGKAIVASASSQATEVIQPHQTGLLVPPGDEAGFAAAVLSLLDSPAERQRLGGNARQQAEALYSWDTYTQRLEEICQRVVKDAAHHAPG